MDALPRYAHQMAHDPSRTPDWRWQRAQWLVEHNLYCKRHRDDAQTHEAAHFLRALRRCHDGHAGGRLLAGFHHIHAAKALRDHGGSGALEVQARLLARQTSDEICRRSGVPSAVIDAFEALFYDVRAHLDARDWVTSQAIDSRLLGLEEPVSAVLYKKFAFFGGPQALEAVHPYLVGGKTLYKALPDLSTPAGRNELKIQLAIASEMLSKDAANARKMQKIELLIAEIARKRHVEFVPTPIFGRNLEFSPQNLASDTLFAHGSASQKASPTAIVPELWRNVLAG